MKVVAFIPARFGSTRLNGKPLADIGGKPMVQRVYERARKARLVNDVTVATDDERILRAVLSFGGRAVMTSVSHRSGTDRIAEAVKDIQADIVVNLQGDEPLIEPAMIDEAVEPLINDPGIVLCTLKTKIREEQEYRDPNVVKVVTDNDGYALYFSRSPIPFGKVSLNDFSACPYKHIGIYVYRKDFLLKFSGLPPARLEETESLEQLRALENGYRIKVVETRYNPVSVDTPHDLDRVRALFVAGKS